MSTITPTSNQTQSINVTTFTVGDFVRALSGPDAGKTGVIVTPNGFVPTLVLLPTPHIEMLPGPLPILASATPASPLTANVDVQWSDGTYSLIALALLGRA
jgi:hypothetical protein